MRGDFNPNKVKDLSQKEQGKYYQGYIKESVQQANFRKRIKSEDHSIQRHQKVERMCEKMSREGIIKHVPGFFRDKLKLKA